MASLVGWTATAPPGWADASKIATALEEIDTALLVEHYRALRTQTLKLETEIALAEVDLHHLHHGNPEAERKVAALAAKLHLLRRLAEQTRTQILSREPRPSESRLSPQPDHPEHRSARAGVDPGPARPAARLQGRWIGREVGQEREAEMTVTGHSVKFRLPAHDEWYVGRLGALEPTDRDGVFALDLEITECVAPEYVGCVAHALVRLGRDRLTLAGTEPGRTPRPKGFEPDRDTRVFVFERVGDAATH